MMAREAFEAQKDPSDISDWDLEWNTHLESGETIATSSWRVSAGLTADSNTYGNTATKVWLRYGTPGKLALLENTITTSGGRTLQRTVELQVAQK